MVQQGQDSFCSCCFSPLKILLDSLRIFLRDKQIFISIFALTTLPLSFLLFNLSISTHPTRSQIYHLQAVARRAPTHVEARHIWQESRDDALSVLRIKSVFFLPCYLLSFIAAVTVVHSTTLAFNAKLPTLLTAFTAVKRTWKRLLVTSIVVYVILLVYVFVPRTLAALTPYPQSKFLIFAIGSGVEVYLMAILSLGLVVSIAEDRYGWDAIQIGSDLMAGRRFCGWLLTGLMVLITSAVARKLEGELKGSPARKWAVGLEDEVGLISLYGLAMVWGYVVMTIFYCECRRRQAIEEEEDKGVSV